jgi:hypothetical protein
MTRSAAASWTRHSPRRSASAKAGIGQRQRRNNSATARLLVKRRLPERKTAHVGGTIRKDPEIRDWAVKDAVESITLSGLFHECIQFGYVACDDSRPCCAPETGPSVKKHGRGSGPAERVCLRAIKAVPFKEENDARIEFEG